MVWHPLHRCIGEHQVIRVRLLPGADVTDFESDLLGRVFSRRGDHRDGTVNPEHGTRTNGFAECSRQATVAATEINHLGGINWLQKADQIPERLLPLGRKLVVLVRIPSVERRHLGSSMTGELTRYQMAERGVSRVPAPTAGLPRTARRRGCLRSA